MLRQPAVHDFQIGIGVGLFPAGVRKEDEVYRDAPLPKPYQHGCAVCPAAIAHHVHPSPPVISTCLWAGMDVQQVAVRAGLEQADAPLGGADQIVLGALQLEVVHVELLVHLAAMEEELMGGNGKQGAGQLPHRPGYRNPPDFDWPESMRNCAFAPA